MPVFAIPSPLHPPSGLALPMACCSDLPQALPFLSQGVQRKCKVLGDRMELI